MDGFRNLACQSFAQSAHVFRRVFGALLLGFACTVSSHAANVVANYTSASVIPVTAATYVASGNILSAYLSFAPRTGANLTVVRNTGSSFIQGRFTDLPHGKVISLHFNGINYRFVANYYGGDGNDLVLEWYRRSVIAWGANGVGQLGNGSTMASKVPVDLSSSGGLADKTVLAVSASTGGHSLALCSDGTMVAWGNNAYGQLGDGTTNPRTTPVAVLRTGALIGKSVIAIATGTHHSLALCSDGTIAAWGRNHKGQLGNGNLTNSSIPVAVTRTGVIAGKIPVQLSSEVDQNMVLCSDGSVATWGDNTFGQLGNGSAAVRSNVPVLLTRSGVLAGKTITSVSMGGSHGLVRCSDGTLATWGANSSGQLGNNTLVASRVPVLVNRSGVLAGKVANLVDAGNNHNLVHCSDGTLASWGGGSQWPAW
jgi:alpha-tubulin suppressor-like RCC1 family protein